MDPDVLIEGILFRARYLGTTQLVCEGRPTKSLRMMQAEEAVSRIKVRVVKAESHPLHTFLNAMPHLDVSFVLSPSILTSCNHFIRLW